MAKKNDRDNLGYLGTDFQYKLAKAFFEDKKFFMGINSIVNQNMFTDASLRTCIGVLKEYYEKYELVPSYKTMEIELRQKAQNEMDREFLVETIKRIKETSLEGTESIHEKADKFFKQQNIVKVANEILKIASDGDITKYPDCVELIQKAMEVGADDDMGISVFDNLDEVLSDEYRTPIPTGVGKVDETLEGGLGKGELGIIVGPSSFGKIQPFDSQIVTPNGYQNMGDIKVGNYVMGRNGKPTKVIGVYPHKDWEFYKVIFSDGTETECGMEHLWNVSTINQRRRKVFDKEKTNGRKTKYCPDFSYKTLSLREIVEMGLKKGNRNNFKIPICDPVEFNEIKVDINPYLLGAMIGDGCFVRKSLTIGIEDIETARNNKYLSEFSHGEHVVHKDSTYEFPYRKDFEKALSKYFDLSLKAKDKYIPKEYLFNSIENRVKLLNGLMDTDGTVKDSGSCRYNTKSERLANDVRTLVLSLGGYSTIHKTKCGYFNKDKNVYVDCGYQYSVSVSFFNPNFDIFLLKRKQDKVRNRFKYTGKYIVDVQFSRKCDGQCIKVDAEDELYLTDNFIVTHNTSLTTAMACHAATHKAESNNNEGFKVLQIVFEDRPKQIQRKYLGRITGIEAKDLSKPDFIDQVKKTITEFEDKEMLKKNVRIKRFPSGEVTATQIGQFIKKLINSGFKPDLVIVDYFECVKLEKSRDSSDSEWTKEGYTMRKFESMAGEMDFALWIPTQGTKDSLGAEIVTMDKAGGSFKKIQIGHIIMSIARTMDDIAKCLATIAVLKNRAGSAGKVFNNVEFNNGTCRISTDNVDIYDSMSEFNANRTETQKKEMYDTAKEVLSKLSNNSTK